MKSRITVIKDGSILLQALQPHDRVQWWITSKGDEFGLPERWVNEDQCSEDDKLASLETRPIEMSDKVEHRLPAQYEIVIEDITAELELKKVQLEARKYLEETDWMVIRQMDSGVEIPAEVKLKRQQARELL